jgi:hypothetical protein
VSRPRSKGRDRAATDSRARLAAAAAEAARTHADWVAAYGSTSWDQYDFWANPLGRRAKAVYYRRPWMGLPLVAPFVLLDAIAPSSRCRFWHRQRFPIADAHYAMGCLTMARIDGTSWVERALPFLEALVGQSCSGEVDYCWGYPFDWETCFGTWPAGTPLITSTPYGYEAFEAAHELTGAPEALSIMESVGRFAFTRISNVDISQGVRAAAYSPIDSRRVVNASAYRGYLLAAAGARFGQQRWVEEAHANLAFVLRSQRDNGSWLYAMDGKDAFVDNFHTCFVLKNLWKAYGFVGDPALVETVRAGYAFYKAKLLDADGLPIPFAKTQRPTLQRRDLYDYAEGINLALLLEGDDPDAAAIASRLVEDLLTDWRLPDGRFVTKRTVVGRNVVPYHRWAQAQTFHALTRYALTADS